MQADQLRKLTRKWAIPIIVVTILGAAASYVVSKRLTPYLRSDGQRAGHRRAGETVGNGSSNTSEATATAASLLTEPSLLNEVISSLKLHMTIDQLSKQVSASAETNGAELVDVTVSDPSPIRAAGIANALMNAYVAEVNTANAARIAADGAAIQKSINSLQATITSENAATGRRRGRRQDTTSLKATIAENEAQQSQLSLQLAPSKPARRRPWAPSRSRSRRPRRPHRRRPRCSSTP